MLWALFITTYSQQKPHKRLSFNDDLHMTRIRYLVTSFKVVPKGKEGVVGAEGSFAGFLAFIFLACTGVLIGETKEYKLINPPKVQSNLKTETKKAYKILLAFSGLKQALTTNPGYNRRVTECQEAAKVLLVITKPSFDYQNVVALYL